MSEAPLRLLGAPGSPYTRKMRAILRYRRIPFRFLIRNSPDDHDIPQVPVSLMPVLILPGEGGGEDRAMVDSTPMIRLLEERQSERSVIPPDPAVAFIDALLEDYGDEWLTKAMFHYRWVYEADIQKAGAILPRWAGPNVPEEQIAARSRFVIDRQVGRLGVVGSNETTKPVIEHSYIRLLERLDAHLTNQPFVMGQRPGASDFALFGQLTQLVQFDPTPAAVALERAPRIYAWIEGVEDLSGREVSDDGWLRRDAIPETLRALLVEAGRVYAPFLLGNAAALERGDAQVECEVDGRKWVQKPFPYQGKCLSWLRRDYAALSDADRTVVDGWLTGTGCETLFSS